MAEEEKNEKIVIFATHGPEDPERATLPFVMGNGALAMDVQVNILLQGNGVLLAKKGCYDHVFASGLPPLKELVGSFIEQGGGILVCTPCLEERKITMLPVIDDRGTAVGVIQVHDLWGTQLF